MNEHGRFEDDRYEQWRRARVFADVPDGFADRVMAALQRDEQRRAVVVLRILYRVAVSPAGRAIVWSAAVALCLAKIAAPAAVLLIP